MAGCAVAAAILVAAVFAAASLLVNAPVAIEGIEGGAVQLRGGWTWFFEFSHDRGATATLWSALEVSVAEANRWSGVLLGAGLAALLGLAARGAHPDKTCSSPPPAPRCCGSLPPGRSTASQYSLWILLALALAGLPLRAMIAVAAIDALLFVTLWGGGLPWLGDPWPATLSSAVRQGGTAVLAVWVMTRITYPARDRPVAAGLPLAPARAPSTSDAATSHQAGSVK